MSFQRAIRLVSAVFTGLAAFLAASSICLGFGASVGGVSVSVRSPGVSISAGTSATGSTSAASVSVGSGGVTAGGGGGGSATVGGSASVSGSGATAAGGATVGSASTAVGTSATVSGSSTTVGGSATVSGDNATVDASASGSGSGAAAGANATVGNDSATVGGSASVSGSGVTASADVSGGSGTVVDASTTGTIAAGPVGAALTAQRAALQMGVGPVEPDRGMAQALGYTGAAGGVVITAADTALNSVVSDLPALPNESADVDASAAATEPAAATDDENSTQEPAKASANERHSDPPPVKRRVAAGASGVTAPLGAAVPPTLNTRKAKNIDKAAPSKPAVAQPTAPPVAIDPVAAAMPVSVENAQPLMSIVVDSDPLRRNSAGQPGLGWTITGHFPDAQTSSLPTGLAVIIVMLLSAGSAYGFVRLMSERCPHCAALLERHSAGCRNCGTRLDSSGPADLRLSS